MRINIQGHTRLAVSQDLGDYDDGYLVIDHNGSSGVAQIVKTDIRQPCPPQDRFEIPSQVARHHRCTQIG